MIALRRSLAVMLALAGPWLAATETIWRLDGVERIGGLAVEREGAPRVMERDGAKCVEFDGVRDGLFLPEIPIAGATAFTIEILFRPDEGGPAAQRFVHLQDAEGKRALLETRLDGKGGWWLDTFLSDASSGGGLALIDPKRVHATGKWYWAALRYDGKTMAHFINGGEELSGAVRFGPMGAGRTSLGVRQNKVYWFKGAIREVRFHREALALEKLQRTP